MSQDLKELRGQLEERRAKLHTVFAEAGADMDMEKVTALPGNAAQKVDAIRALSAEIDDLAAKAGPLEANEAALLHAKRQADEMGAVRGRPVPVVPRAARQDAPPTTLGAAFLASDAYQRRVSGGQGPVAELDVEVGATLFQTSAGWAPQSIRSGVVVPYATRPIQVMDIIPQGNTGQAAYVYMEETTLTDNAAEVAEGGTYGEAAFALTERSNTVRKIGAWLPVTDEQLEDIAGAESYINQRLPFLVLRRADTQVLNGDGNAPNLLGLLNASGLQTQAKGTLPSPDAIYKACTKIRVTGRAAAGAAVMHPTDWEGILLLRTADGVYIWGNPAEAGPERIWGLPVVQTDAIAQGTALVGDFGGYCMFFMRRGVEMQVSNSHDDYFIKGKQAVRADFRGVLATYRGAAFCTVTGL